MANNITKATNYLADPQNLNGVYVAESQLCFLMKEKFKVVNGDTIELPLNQYGASEIPNYNRGDGYSKVAITRTWDTYKLLQDWGMELEMDEMDKEESLSEGIISFGNDATRKLTVPRGDKYIATKLIAKAGKKVLGLITEDNILDEIDDAVVYFQEEGVTGQLHLLLTPDAYKALKNADGITRQLNVQDERTGINRTVEYLDDIEVHVIKGKRLTEETNFVLVSEDSVFGVVKHNPSYFFAAGSYPGKDASVVDIRLYFDFFVIENRQNGIYAHITTDDKVTVTFNTNAGQTIDSEEVEGVVPVTNPTIEVFEGRKTGLPATPTSTTHTFKGWFYDNNTFARPYSGNRPIKDDVTVYANWEAND